jgi:hypothetical protein
MPSAIVFLTVLKVILSSGLSISLISQSNLLSEEVLSSVLGVDSSVEGILGFVFGLVSVFVSLLPPQAVIETSNRVANNSDKNFFIEKHPFVFDVKII